MRDLPREHSVHTDLDGGMLLPKLGEGGEERVNGALVHSQRELATLQALQFREPFLGFIAQINQALRIVLQKCARIGEADRPRATNEERLAERVLKLADGQADSGLGAIEALGGAGKAALFRHHQEYLQFTEVQGDPLRRAV